MRLIYKAKKLFRSITDTRDELYRSLVSGGDIGKKYWIITECLFGVVSIIFGLYWYFCKRTLGFDSITILWMSVGFMALAIGFIIIQLNWNKSEYERLDCFKKVFFAIALINFPCVLMFSYISKKLSRYDIDLDTYMIPFYLIPIDTFVVAVIFGVLDQNAKLIDDTVKKYEASLRNWDLNAVFVLFCFFLAWIAMYIVNRAGYYLMKHMTDKKVSEEINEDLVKETTKEERLSVPQTVQTSKELKRKRTAKFEHGWTYINAAVAKFQLALMIFLFILVVFFPGEIAIPDETTRTSYVNTITFITLIMLYFDKHNAWDDTVHQSATAGPQVDEYAEEDTKNFVH